MDNWEWNWGNQGVNLCQFYGREIAMIWNEDEIWEKRIWQGSVKIFKMKNIFAGCAKFRK